MRVIVDCSTGETSLDANFVPPADKRSLDEIKEGLLRAVDAAANDAMPSHPSRAALYAEKFAEANAVTSGLDRDQANTLTPEQIAQSFPFLSASIGVEAPTLYDVAQIIISKNKNWSQTAALVERVRLAAKRDIAIATTRDDALAAFEGIKWPEHE